MRHIDKRLEPPELEQWRTSGTEDWQPSYEDLRGDLKRMLHAARVAEQGWVCCYCERRITDDRGVSHIEHLRPQRPHGVGDATPADALDYRNLLCSCNTNGVHCGARKGNKVLAIDPGMPDCTSHFVFHSNGAMEPCGESTSCEKARDTIAVLGLDTLALRMRRREAWGALIEQIAREGVDTASLPGRLLAWDGEGRHLPHAAALSSIVRAVL
ncbi:MAG: TIGR02646 family protein [Planctomycetes bacterium]|nr:TIGR02646 family protein [Planctomycetota bacterium]